MVKEMIDMNKTYVLLAGLLAVSLLLFGCTNPKATNKNQTVIKNGNNDSIKGVKNTTQSNEPQLNLTGMTTAELVALNKQIKCTFSSTTGTESINFVWYTTGTATKIEARGTSSRMGNVTTTYVFKNNKTYIKSDSPWYHLGAWKDCDWLVIDNSGYSTENSGNSASTMITTPSEKEIDNMTKDNYHCQMANIGSKVFDTSGKVCDILKMQKEMEQEYNQSQ